MKKYVLPYPTTLKQRWGKVGRWGTQSFPPPPLYRWGWGRWGDGLGRLREVGNWGGGTYGSPVPFVPLFQSRWSWISGPGAVWVPR